MFDALPAALVLAGIAAVAVLGWTAHRWFAPAPVVSMDEWGLAGRRFGTWTTFLLVSGNFYTAFHMIWIPAQAYEVGATGFLAIPYSLCAIPFIAVIMPRLWRTAAAGGHVTTADIVQAHHGNRALTLAVAVIGITVTIPYIALLFAPLRTVLADVGLGGPWWFAGAIGVAMLYSGRSGLRAPAASAALKGIATFLVLGVAAALIAWRIGGIGTLTAAADAAFRTSHTGSTTIGPADWAPYLTAAFGFTTSAFVYPHTVMGLLAARSGQTVARTLWLLPLFTLVALILALLAYAAYALALPVHDPNTVTPMVFGALFPHWFTGVAFATLAMAAISPATMLAMAGGALFARTLCPGLSPTGQVKAAKAASVSLELAGALLLLGPPFLPAVGQFFGNIWGLQTAPALLAGLYTSRLTGRGLLAGLVSGVAVSTWLGLTGGVMTVFHVGDFQVGVMAGVVGLAVNLAVVACAGYRPSLSARRRTAG